MDPRYPVYVVGIFLPSMCACLDCTQERQVVERPVRPIPMYSNSQACIFHLSIRQIFEAVHTQALLPRTPAERLRVGILSRLA